MDRESQERQEGGRFKSSVTHEDVLDVFELVEGPIITSSDVADVCNCSPKTARRKLDELAAQKEVEGRETAGRTVWWRIGPAATQLTLKRLSKELSQPILVGDRVYEDGDMHPLSDATESTEDPRERQEERR